MGVKLKTNIQKSRDADVKMITLRGVKRRRPKTMMGKRRAIGARVSTKTSTEGMYQALEELL
jgi:hypothetical protein